MFSAVLFVIYLEMQSPVPKARLIMLSILILMGVLIVALPDNNQRLFSIRRQHGPSFQDMIGLLLILIPYFYLVYSLWKRRKKLNEIRRHPFFKTGFFLFISSSVLLIISVMNDFGWWWLAAAFVMAFFQGYVFYFALR